MTTFDHAALTEQGPVRGKNEDSITYVIPDDPYVLAHKGALFVVADGVGGHGAGDVASSAATKIVQEQYYSHKGNPDKALRHAFHMANFKVFDLGIESNRYQMQTTLTALVIVGDMYFIAHIGDTRIYRFRESTDTEQLTTDHSEVGELLRMGIITPDKLRTHPRRSIITRSVGSQAVVQAMTRQGQVREGDYFAMCTDGVWEPVMEDEIRRAALNMAPMDACQSLVNLGIERNVRDNLSIQILKVETVEVPAGSKYRDGSGLVQRLFGFFGSSKVAAK